MPNRQGSAADARRQAPRLLTELGDELREARLRSGLTQAAVARALGTTRRRLGWIEAGRAPAVAVAEVARHAGLVGLRLSVKCYPSGPPIRDAAQVALLARLQPHLGPIWRIHLESPLLADRDRRAWDMLLVGPNLTIGVEAISRLRDVQAQLRAAQLKRRDSDTSRLLLLVAATHANRRALSAAAPLIRADLAIGTRESLAALRAGRDPGADALVLL